MQQDSVGFYSGERNEGRNGDFETEHLYQLLNGLREDLVRAEGDPSRRYQCVNVYSLVLRVGLPEERGDNAGSP